jgi:hypothetical protein
VRHSFAFSKEDKEPLSRYFILQPSGCFRLQFCRCFSPKFSCRPRLNDRWDTMSEEAVNGFLAVHNGVIGLKSRPGSCNCYRRCGFIDRDRRGCDRRIYEILHIVTTNRLGDYTRCLMNLRSIFRYR